MPEPRNVIVAQSGGPSPVINNSVRGVVETCLASPKTFGTVYAAWHGIEGVLKEELLDLSAQPREEIALLRTTPAAGAIGTCRYKLKEGQDEDFERVVQVLKAHQVGYFFYTGGNDSMDTAHKIALLAADRGLDLVATGVPKTIDNDVGDSEFQLIDHTPGYGSVARYWALAVQGANEENAGSCPADPVLVMQAMGRKIGFIPAAARLADPGRDLPLHIYLAEAGVPAPRQRPVPGRGKRGVRRGRHRRPPRRVRPRAVLRLRRHRRGCRHGLPERQGPARGRRRPIQRITASTVDLDEAYKVGCKAAHIAAEDGSGWMATILREPGSVYRVRYDKVPLKEVASSERTFPQEWIAENRRDVTDAFVEYARPLIGDDWPSVPLVDGRQRFARFRPVFAEKTCPDYVPQAYRK